MAQDRGAPTTTGWMIGVLVELPDGGLERQFYAAAREDRAHAEWSAVDMAIAKGPIAVSPSRGIEPVQAIAQLSAAAIKTLGLAPGQVMALGSKWPRRWVGAARAHED